MLKAFECHCLNSVPQVFFLYVLVICNLPQLIHSFLISHQVSLCVPSVNIWQDTQGSDGDHYKVLTEEHSIFAKSVDDIYLLHLLYSNIIFRDLKVTIRLYVNACM